MFDRTMPELGCIALVKYPDTNLATKGDPPLSIVWSECLNKYCQYVTQLNV